MNEFERNDLCDMGQGSLIVIGMLEMTLQFMNFDEFMTWYKSTWLNEFTNVFGNHGNFDVSNVRVINHFANNVNWFDLRFQLQYMNYFWKAYKIIYTIKLIWCIGSEQQLVFGVQ